jgi:predicted porin
MVKWLSYFFHYGDFMQNTRFFLMSFYAFLLLFSHSVLAETVLSGSLHVSVDWADNGRLSSTNVTSNLSNFVLSGEELMFGNTRALFQITNNISFSEDGYPTDFAACETFVGVASPWGSVKIGKLFTAASIPSAEFNLFSGQVGDSLDILNYTRKPVNGKFSQTEPEAFIYDGCYAGAILYSLPDSPFRKFSIQYVPDEADDDAAILSIGGLSHWRFLTIGIGYENQGKGYNVGGKASEVWRVGMGATVKNAYFSGLYQFVKNAGGLKSANGEVYGLSGSYNFGHFLIKASYFQTKNKGKENDASLSALGLDYFLSKRTRIYGAYALFNNEKYVAYGIGHGYGDHGNLGILPNAGNDLSVFSLGFMHDF